MRKLIDLEAAIEVIRFDSDRIPDDLNSKQVTAYRNGMYAAISSISSCPAIENTPVVHGRWKYYHKQNMAVCTNCSFERDLDANFGKVVSCPNCGARMDGGDTDDP